jgi:UDP-N-acetylglucosamine 2-epimerase
MKIVSIVGARPQFIKLAPLSEKLSRYHDEIILHTGQHYDHKMSDSFFKELNIKPPKYNLDVRSGGHGEQTAKMLQGIEKILLNEKPDLVVVFGDTNSTLAGAIAASKLGIKIIHVEAGLRSYNRSMPEEINRIVTDHTSDYLFAPTLTAKEILSHEGLEKRTYMTGDIMVDTVERNIKIADQVSNIVKELGLTENEFYLLTLHRPYNVDNPKVLIDILNMAAELDHKVLFPAHPRTVARLKKMNFKVSWNIKIIEPLGYLDFIKLQSASYKILTDSGGIQKEAYILNKPCITLRSETEWVETVEEGWNLLMKPQTELDANAIMSFNPSHKQTDIFGRNNTDKMVEIINSIKL